MAIGTDRGTPSAFERRPFGTNQSIDQDTYPQSAGSLLNASPQPSHGTADIDPRTVPPKGLEARLTRRCGSPGSLLCRTDFDLQRLAARLQCFCHTLYDSVLEDEPFSSGR